MVDSREAAGRVVALSVRLLDGLGTAVAQPRTPGGTTPATEDLEVLPRLSGAVVREVRVPERNGLVTGRRRVGLTVRPTRCGNVDGRRVNRARPAAGAAEAATRALPAWALTARAAGGTGVAP